MSFEQTWNKLKVELPPVADQLVLSQLRSLCEEAYRAGYGMSYKHGYEDGYMEGREVGRYEQMFDARHGGENQHRSFTMGADVSD